AYSSVLFPVKPGKGEHKDAPAVAAYGFHRDDGSIAYLVEEDGAAIMQAQVAAQEEAKRALEARLGPELLAAWRRYKTADRAYEAEDTRAYDLLLQGGF